jgi:hypothetical protein
LVSHLPIGKPSGYQGTSLTVCLALHLPSSLVPENLRNHWSHLLYLGLGDLPEVT